MLQEEVRTLEQTAMRDGTKVNIGKGVDYYVYDDGEVIGATAGQEAKYLRVEKTSNGGYHGHPITQQEYKGIKKMNSVMV